jgi:uncharacterized iron-regulated protein
MKCLARGTYLIAAALLLLLGGCWTSSPAPAKDTQARRASLWVDALEGEPVTFQSMLEDLRQARVIYLGEVHSITRHHELETELLEGLAEQGVGLVLAMEQFEFFAQPALDRFNSGAIDLAGLVREGQWDKRWSGHTNYHGLLAAARAHGIPVLALNARAETIRAVGRAGLANLSPEQRRELPEQIVTEDPLYERWLDKVLGVHLAFDPTKLQSAFQAQVARDETMAERLAAYLNSPAGGRRTALVVCGRGHCEFGLGTPTRVARRLPGISQRIVLFSESGDLRLSDVERRQSRDVEISHEFLKELSRPPGDYVHVTASATGSSVK